MFLQNCNKDTEARTRNDRMRAYEKQTFVPGCPRHSYVFREWLWIDNATEADARNNYSCRGRSLFYSPIRRSVLGQANITLTPGIYNLQVSNYVLGNFGSQ